MFIKSVRVFMGFEQMLSRLQIAFDFQFFAIRFESDVKQI